MDTENRHYKLTTLIDGVRERDARTRNSKGKRKRGFRQEREKERVVLGLEKADSVSQKPRICVETPEVGITLSRRSSQRVRDEWSAS